MKKGQIKSLPGLKSGQFSKNNAGQGNMADSDGLPAKNSDTIGNMDRHESVTAADPDYQESKNQEMYAPSEDVYRAIRLKCLECSGDSKDEVRLCNRRTCPLFAYRLGRQRVVIERSRAGNGPHQGSLLEI